VGGGHARLANQDRELYIAVSVPIFRQEKWPILSEERGAVSRMKESFILNLEAMIALF
jgi:hypothetical protein